jgi:hypothetical protein
VTQEPDTRLPVRVGRVGGALASVLAWEQHIAVLTRSQMFVIADIVQKFPDLNTEFAVDLLADLAGYHGQQMNSWFDALIDEYGIERIHLAVQCMEEFGIRTAAENAAAEGDEEDGTLADMLAWFQRLAELEYDVHSVEGLSNYILILGGWSNAKRFTTDELRKVLVGEIEHHELESSLVQRTRDDHEEEDEEGGE